MIIVQKNLIFETLTVLLYQKLAECGNILGSYSQVLLDWKHIKRNLLNLSITYYLYFTTS